jgi:hypothetical protein
MSVNVNEAKREEFRKLMRAYAGFQAATILWILAKPETTCAAKIATCLFVISIPSTVALSWSTTVDRHHRLVFRIRAP